MTTDVHPDEVLKAILDKGNRRDKEEKLRNHYARRCVVYLVGEDDYSVAEQAGIDIV